MAHLSIILDDLEGGIVEIFFSEFFYYKVLLPLLNLQTYLSGLAPTC